jgi:hypothetical protein
MRARQRKPGAGRKPKGEFPGKSSTLTTRLTPATRAGLEREATRSGRSLSQEVERRLVQSLEAPSAIAKRAFGNDRNKALAVLVAKLATQIELLTGKSWRADRFTFEAVARGMPVLLQWLAPPGESTVPEQVTAIGKGSPNAALWEQPERLGVMCASGLLDQLRLATAPPRGHGPDVYFADEYYQFPKLKRDLELMGDDT